MRPIYKLDNIITKSQTKEMKKLLQFLSILTILLGISISIIYVLELKLDWMNVGKSAQIGDFIGGVVGTIFSLSAFLQKKNALKANFLIFLNCIAKMFPN